VSSHPAPSFDEVWARFQALTTTHPDDETLEEVRSRGRAQYLLFLARVDDPAAVAHLTRVAARLADVPGVEPYPASSWHVALKGVGFQVIQRTFEDDVLRQDVPRLAAQAKTIFAEEPAFDVRLGLVNAAGGAVFVEVWEDAPPAGRPSERLRALHQRLLAELPDTARYPDEGEAFLPHVRIARLRSSDQLAPLQARLRDLRAEGPGPTLRVGRVEFVKAWLSEEAPELQTLAVYTLGGAR
jgi:2'-5' RNA ligase